MWEGMKFFMEGPIGKQWGQLLIKHGGIWDTWDGDLDQWRNDLGTVIFREKRKQSSSVDGELHGQWDEGDRKLHELGVQPIVSVPSLA